MTPRTLAALSTAAFLGCIILANYATTRYGLVNVGFGLSATAGTYLAGLTFVLRDVVQDALGRRGSATLIVLGAGLSFAIADPFIAFASGVAFLASESADMLIWTPLRDRGYLRAAIASNTVGTLVDTFLFLWVAGFPVASAWQGQAVGKMTVTLIFAGLIVIARRVRSAKCSTSPIPADLP